MTSLRAPVFLICLILVAGAWRASAEAAKAESHDSDHDHGHDHGKDHSHEHAGGHDHGHKLNDTHGNGTARSSQKSARHSWEPYVYGSISVAVVSLLSLAGVIVIPFIKNKIAYDSVMLTFMALAVGCMTSDALLHLVPETLGLDAHDDDGDEAEGEHHHHEEEESHEYLGKMCCLLGTLYGLYLLELILHTGAKLFKKPKVGQNVENGVIKAPTSVEKTGHGHGHGHSHGGLSTSEGGPESHTILGLKSVAFVIVLSDAMHNFTDGLAIGAAFSKSSAAGLGVTIAVVCHELPHEIGNFAILLNTGMGLKKALLLNFLSAVTSFAGLYPGIVAGQQESLSRWIFAAVAAGFLYVALVHMLRELQSFSSIPWHLSFVLQNLGMLFGFAVIFLLALYEHELEALT